MYKDLREFLTDVEEHGELVRLTGVDPRGEIGRITEMVEYRSGSPTILFDNITGYPEGYRVLVNFFATPRQIGLTLDMPGEIQKIGFVRRWRDRVRNLELLPPRKVEWGPILENVILEKDLDVFSFPAPLWRTDDGGPFIGTADVVITRDPDSGRVNLGVYRSQAIARDVVGCFFDSPTKHGFKDFQKYVDRGEPCPIAIAAGVDPFLFVMASVNIPEEISEYDFAGGFRREPVDVIESDLTGLPLTAHAEIILEGELHPDYQYQEGPFGEWTGYYGGSGKIPCVKVKRILHRNDPIITGKPSLRPPSGWDTVKAIRSSAGIWDGLEGAGVKGVRGVWCHEAGAGRFFNVISLEQQYPGHSRQAAFVAAQCREGVRGGRYVIIVDEDIDPCDLHQVIWAVSTRTDPVRSIEFMQKTLTTKLDPIVRKGESEYTSRAIIDACRPWERRKEFPRVSGSPAGELAEVEKKWGGRIFTKGR